MPFLAPTRTSPTFVWRAPTTARKAAARLAAVATTVLTLGVLVATLGATPGYAAPGTLAVAPSSSSEDEGGSDSLREQLQTASKGYVNAKNKLDNSVKRQKELTTRLGTLRTEVTTRSERVAQMAGMAYRTGRLGQVSALLNSGSPTSLVDRAAALDTISANESRELRGLRESIEEETRAKEALDQEIREQRKQVEVMETRKKQAEKALAAANSGGSSSGISGSGAASARPAPRNADGSFPDESCSLNDPTTSGCITARTLHALNQAKAAGFTRYVSCFRSGGSGEHPKGQACDFAAQKGGFGGVATGGDRTYGNNLAAYFVRNADRLGVLYVIWFKQIWLPSSGWKTYNSGNGDPSSDHTNHVHLSMN
ncbi:coiled-coil domain-containing protein [Plantactinospora solaniradicis]|uniref:Coiled-coil domain-containing protein n=1 Tax=Plantactinospora solaniradicis TaxID=1723736 RepID=A0ABW1KMV9_9ACTN